MLEISGMNKETCATTWREPEFGEDTIMNNSSVYVDKSRLHQTEDYGRTFLPKLVADATFQHTAGGRTVPQRMIKSEEGSMRSRPNVETVTKQRSLSTSFSLPHLVSYRELVSGQSNSTTSSNTRNIHGNADTSDQSANEDGSDEEVNISIDPYPNIGVESVLNSSYTLKEVPPTPPRRRKRKETNNKMKIKQENDAKTQRQKRAKVKTVKRWNQSERNRQRDLARRHPVRKQFLYSEIMEEELKSHIPKRMPGGKLKPIYKRTSDGDIFVPNYPLNINLERLNIRENEDISLAGCASDLNKFRKRELREMLEKRKKVQLKKLKKKQKRVRFILPSTHVDSEESDSENLSNVTGGGRSPVCSPTSGKLIDKFSQDESEIEVRQEENDPELLLLQINEHSSTNSDKFESKSPTTSDKQASLLDSADLLTRIDPQEISSDAEERDSTSAIFKLPVIKDAKAPDQTDNDTITLVDTHRFRISKANGNAMKYTRLDSI